MKTKINTNIANTLNLNIDYRCRGPCQQKKCSELILNKEVQGLYFLLQFVRFSLIHAQIIILQFDYKKE